MGKCSNCSKETRPGAKFCNGCGNNLISSSDNMPLKNDAFLDKRYKIIQLIKKGGMGAVYKAIDSKLERICAIKELIPLQFQGPQEYKDKTTEWFNREAKILARLDHANLPGVIDYFITNDRYYLVMDFVDGEDLKAKLKKDGNPGLGEEEIVNWTGQILRVLDYLHSQDPPVIYRDLKPENIMIHKDGRAMLIDFGIARTIPKDRKLPVSAVGTIGYIPPEQYKGKAQVKSDLFSLAATMHHLLTGKAPVSFQFETVREINPEISSFLEYIIMKALSLRPEDRYKSAEAMLEDLTANRTDIEEKISNPPLPQREAKKGFLSLKRSKLSWSLGESKWKEIESGITADLVKVSFSDQSNWWSLSIDGMVFYTINGGAKWNKLLDEKFEKINNVQFDDEKNVKIIGTVFKNFIRQKVVYNTENAGKTWDILPFDKEYETSSVSGELKYTWAPHHFPEDLKLIDKYVFDDQKGWIIGENRSHKYVISSTTDKGITWINEYKTSKKLYSISFFSENVGWAVGIKGTLLEYSP